MRELPQVAEAHRSAAAVYRPSAIGMKKFAANDNSLQKSPHDLRCRSFLSCTMKLNSRRRRN